MIMDGSERGCLSIKRGIVGGDSQSRHGVVRTIKGDDEVS